MPPRVLVLHGPNLNLLLDLEQLDRELDERARSSGLDLKTFHSNSEGALVDALHAERTKVSGVIVNAAKLAPSAEVLAEALSLLERPVIEVLLEPGLKARSALKAVVLKQVTGRDGYFSAVEVLGGELKKLALRPTGSLPAARADAPQATVTDDENTGPIPRDEVVKKTLGRKPGPPRAEGGARKTIGRTADHTQKVAGALSRSEVREKIAERLSGKLSPAGLATWARGQWQQIQRGAPVESGQRDRLEDVLQTLLLSASTKANDHQLIELMTQLG